MTSLSRLLLVAVTFAASAPVDAAPQRPYFNAALMDKERAAPAPALRRDLLDGWVAPGAALHEDRRVGVPNFLWAAPGVDLSVIAPGQDGVSPKAAARAYLHRYAGAYRMTAREVEDAIVREVHDTGRGAIVVSFEQRVKGLPVFGDEWRVILDRSLGLVALSGHLSPGARTVLGDFSLSDQDAVALAFNDLTGLKLQAADLEWMGTDEGGYALSRQQTTMTGVSLLDLARARPVMFALPGGAVPAYYVEVQAGIPVGTDSDHYSYVISAVDGRVLFRNNLTVRHSFRVFADSATFIPFDGPQGDGATPHPTGVPDGYQAPFFPGPNYGTNLLNVPALFGRATAGDLWLPASATVTTGNNAEAYADLVSGDGFTNGDVRADVTSAGVFDYVFNPNLGPQVSTAQQKAAVVELFYLNNFLHDWYYDSGFNEAARNAQTNNYGRGGLGNDSLKVEAQDYSGTDNANMSTPADGSRPRMQMYVFSGMGSGTVTFNSPASLAGAYEAGTAEFGAQVFDVTQNVVAAVDSGGASTTDGCEAITNGAQLAGKIALVDRGTCNFSDKAKNAQLAGAAAVLVANNAPGIAGMAGTDATVTIGALMISQAQGAQIRTELGNGVAVNARARRVVAQDRDGTMDNVIVAHEWGHYISNRLINNANGLGNNQGGSMGEGWGDFTALHMIVRPQDAATPQGANFNGVYGLSGYVMSGGANQGYYYGIRRLPYSTDFTRNALTFRHIQDYVPLDPTVPTAFDGDGAYNSEVHNAGEVWASMLWECYAALLRDTLGGAPRLSFTQAQTRMRDYLVAGYKSTPANPTFLEARDALLSAIRAADATDHQRCFVAFARRGAGLDAVAPDRTSYAHTSVVEQFSPDISFVSATLAEDTPNCDGDGRVDSAEAGLLTVTLKNVGLAPLTGTTVTVSSPTSGVSFPNGTQLVMPSYAPGAIVNRGLKVQLPGGLSGLQQVTFNLAISDPNLLVPRTITQVVSLPVNGDLAANSSLTDSAEGPAYEWVVGGSPANAPDRWRILEAEGGTHWWHNPSAPSPSDQTLTSPPFAVGGSNLTVTLRHRYRFEEGTSQNGSVVYYDGAVIQCSPDGATWYDLPLNTGRNLVSQGQNPLRGDAAFAGMSPDYPAFVTQTFTASAAQCRNAPGVRIRLRVGSDAAVDSSGWDVDQLTLGGGVTQGPFDVLVGDPGTAPVANAGGDFQAAEGSAVMLGGTASDCDGDALTYAWTGPPGVTLAGANTLTPSFTAPAVTANTPYTFTLTVRDARGQTTTDSVVVTVTNTTATNQAPVASAGSAQTVAERTAVTLAGTASDPDGDPLTYSWTQQSGPTVTLSGATTLAPTFTAPEVGSAGATLAFRLTVSDGVATATSTVQVSVTHVNRPPVANAGSAQTVNERTAVTLSGTGTDPDTAAPNSDTLTYAWTQQSGPVVTLGGATTLSPSFTAPEVGSAGATLAFRLTVSDGTASATSTVQITVAHVNRPPVASAGTAQTADERSVVTLNGTGTDPDTSAPNSDTLTYAWTQQSGPAVTLAGATTLSPSFTAPEVGNAGATLAFRLTVSDGTASATSTAQITVVHVNRPPVANAGPTQTVPERTPVILSGTATDPDTAAPNSDGLTYAWAQVSGPSVTLAGATTLSPSFTAPEVGTSGAALTFRLTVSDGTVTASDTVQIDVTQVNRPPTANAGTPQSVGERSAVTLSGTAADPDTVAPNSDSLTFAWTQESGPAVTLAGATTLSPTFTAPEVGAAGGTLSFRLTVSDGTATATSTVQVAVAHLNRPPVAAAGAAQSAAERTQVALSGTASDPDTQAPNSDLLTYAWTQQAGPSVTLVGANTLGPTFQAPEVGNSGAALTFALTVSDGTATSSSTVEVTVTHVNRPPVADAGNAQTVSERAQVALSGSASDPDTAAPNSDVLTYSWAQLSGPPVTLAGATTLTPSFTAPEVGSAGATLGFELTVSDGQAVANSSVQIEVAEVNRAPLADAGEALTVDAAAAVTLDGSASEDPDGDPLSYSWTQLSGPAVQLSNAGTAAPGFTAPSLEAGTSLTFRLVVSDGRVDSAPAEVTVTVRPAPAATDAGTDTDGGTGTDAGTDVIPGGGEDGGTTGPGEEPAVASGCACGAAGGEAGPGAIGLGLLVALIAARRRRLLS